MPPHSRFWADLTTRDFAQLDPAATVAVLPVAATEQHGPHLPLSVDQTLVDGVVARGTAPVARRGVRAVPAHPAGGLQPRALAVSPAR